MGVFAGIVNVLISLGFPLAVLLYLTIKKRMYLKYFLFGVCGFTLSQVVVRIPLLGLVQDTSAYQNFAVLFPLLLLFSVCLSAGLFEEPARYLFMRPSRKKEIDLRIPLFYGLGHGGIEAIFLVGLNNLVLLFAQPDLLNNMGVEVFLGGFERISAMMVHLAFSFVVYYGIMKAKKRYLLLTILLHTLFNFNIVLTQYGVSLPLLEVILFTEALAILILVVFLIRKAFPGDDKENDRSKDGSYDLS